MSVAVAPKWGEIVDGKKYYPVHKAQQDILHSNARFSAFIAGTGSGKTAIGPLWLANRIQKTGKGGLYMVIAPTYKVLQRATVPTLIEMFKNTPLEGEYKITYGIYELPRGLGKIYCQGADNPGGLEGGQFDGVWLDESGQMKLSVWIAIQGRTGLKRAPVLLTTTPYGKNWLFSDFYEHFKNGDPDYYVRQCPSHANPAYSKEEYDRAKRTMSPVKARMRYDGEFMKLEGLVYPDFDSTECDLSLDEVLEKDGRFYGGIDFGWNDPFCGLCSLLERSTDILYVWYERYKSETPIEEHAKKLPKFNSRSVLWYADHIPELIRKLRLGGHRVRKANKAIIPGIDAINARIGTGRLKVLKNRCPVIFSEAESYKYPEDDEEVVGDKPVDKDNHAMDSLRYIVAGIDLKRAA